MKFLLVRYILLACIAPLAFAAEQPVPVTQEPFHKTVFENDHVRVIDVQIPVGKTTLYHVHVLPSVVVYLTKSTNRSQTWGETTTSPRATTPGDSRYAPYDEKSLTHQVTNPGPAPFRVLDIELLKPPGTTGSAAHAQPNLQLRWDEKRARSYSLTLEPGAQSEFAASSSAHLVIGIGGAVFTSGDTSPKREVLNGDFAYYPARSRFQVRNTGREIAEVVLLELK